MSRSLVLQRWREGPPCIWHSTRHMGLDAHCPVHGSLSRAQNWVSQNLEGRSPPLGLEPVISSAIVFLCMFHEDRPPRTHSTTVSRSPWEQVAPTLGQWSLDYRRFAKGHLVNIWTLCNHLNSLSGSEVQYWAYSLEIQKGELKITIKM